ncbi:hypothetical protein ACLB1N_32145 [Escherichia coli]
MLDESWHTFRRYADGETAFRCTTPMASGLLTAHVCRERNIKLDEAGFEAAMEEQRLSGARSQRLWRRLQRNDPC